MALQKMLEALGRFGKTEREKKLVEAVKAAMGYVCDQRRKLGPRCQSGDTRCPYCRWAAAAVIEALEPTPGVPPRAA